MTQKEKLIKLGMTAEEADSVLASDRQVDKMTRMADINADLSEEQKKAVKQAKNVKNYAKTARKPKEKVEKMEIIAAIADCLTPLVDGLSVENAERIIKFVKNGQNYSITLTKHRKQGKNPLFFVWLAAHWSERREFSFMVSLTNFGK